MRIIITGGTGFIGKNLINKINLKQNKIYIISRENNKNFKNVKFIKSNLNKINKKKKEINKIKPELLIHLAWEGIPNYEKSISLQNYKDQIKFFNSLKKINSLKHIIVTGTCAEYNALNGKFSENFRGNNNNYLSNSKFKIYKHIKKIFDKKIKISWLRLFYVYGKYQREDALIPYLISKVKKKEHIILKTPNQAKDFVNVQDVCSAIIFFIKKKHSGIFNIGTGQAYSPLRILNIIKKNCNTKVKLIYKKKSKKTKFVGNIRKINKLGWKPKHNLKEYIKNKFN